MPIAIVPVTPNRYYYTPCTIAFFNGLLALMPGHAYFLAETEPELHHRLQYDLMPLIREYLVEGRLGSCESELHAYLDWLEGELAVVS